jgi:hypothetical protein
MSDTASLIARIEAAFSGVPYPGDFQIVRCEYDKAWGGSQDGPCPECAEVVSGFAGENQFHVAPGKLSWLSFSLKSFSDGAFLYWLPAFLIAGATHPTEAGMAIDSVAHVFTPVASQSGIPVSYRADLLSRTQLEVAADWFRQQHATNQFDADEVRPVLDGIQALLVRSDT